MTARIWIDLANSPHPLLFGPVAQRLEQMGHTVLITARDNAQTVELARDRWPDLSVIGGPSPPSRRDKAAAIAGRVRDLAAWARRQRPDLALSHNSYAQIVAAAVTGVPAATAMDYEHQPANHLAFRAARLVMLPEALRSVALRAKGVTGRKVRFYPGLKEELYLGDFEPDGGLLANLGLERSQARPLVVARTPPSGAAYHQGDNPLFGALLSAVAQRGSAQIVVLARRQDQRDFVASLGLANCTIPAAAIDSRTLVWNADLMIGAGGTMTREAALMGVPTVSIFAGRPAAVDSWLESRGLLTRIDDPRQLPPLTPRPSDRVALGELRERGRKLVDVFATTALSLLDGRAKRAGPPPAGPGG